MIFNSLIPSGGTEIKTVTSYSHDGVSINFAVDGEPKWWLVHAITVSVSSSTRWLAVYGSDFTGTKYPIYVSTSGGLGQANYHPSTSYSNGTFTITRYSSTYSIASGASYKYTLYYTT